MYLIITEKPSVSQKLAYAIADGKRNIEIVRRGGVTSYKIQKESVEIFIAPSVGHLFTLKEKEGVDKNTLPIFNVEWRPIYEVNKEARYMKKYLDNLRDLSIKADKIIIATDYDLEGDLIGANIVRHFGNLESARRMRFSTLASSELRYAYENLENINIYNILAAETRHIIDWIYGINFSRAIMHALRTTGKSKILSIGRVQGPFLKYLVERQREIENFSPQDFWELYAIVQNISFLHERGRFFDEKEVYKAQVTSSSKGEIEMKKEKKNIYPAPPFDFTSLQIEAYKNFGFTPIQTEQIAQSLYTNAYISYPRTSSQKLPRQLNLPSVIEKLSKIDEYNLIASQLLKEGSFRPREGTKEDVHPAIYPTGILDRLKTDEKKLYDLIVSRFLACFMEPAEIEDITFTLVAGNQKYLTSARSIIKQGWLQAYGKYSGLRSTNIPPFSDGQVVKIDKFEILKKQTSPPPRYTPATIIQVLEEQGIGTKTTRGIILDTLYKRGYITGRQIRVTPLGVAIYDAFSKYVPLVVDPELTRRLEREMEAIQEDKMTQQEVLEDAKSIIREVIHEMSLKENEIGNEILKQIRKTEEFSDCKCGGRLRIIQKGKSKFLGCTNYPRCKITYSLPYDLFNYAEQCKTCGAPVIWLIRGKQKFKICLNNLCPTKLKKTKVKKRQRNKNYGAKNKRKI